LISKRLVGPVQAGPQDAIRTIVAVEPVEKDRDFNVKGVGGMGPRVK
jgi:hypothetical protein